jgi:hypothetical protein
MAAQYALLLALTSEGVAPPVGDTVGRRSYSGALAVAISVSGSGAN